MATTDYLAYSSCLINAAAKDTSAAQIQSYTSVHDPHRVALIRAAFIHWTVDFGCLYNDVWAAWATFWSYYMRLDSTVNVTLGSVDIQNYTEAIQDVRNHPIDNDLTTQAFTPLLLTQIFALNGTYIGAWVSCTIQYEQYFWIFFDDDWNITLFEGDAASDNRDGFNRLQQHVLQLTGAGGYNFQTYHANGRWDRVIEGQYPRK